MTGNLVPLREPGRVLACLFPYAGGSASSYWPWPGALGQDFAVSAAQLPGRQDRWSEAPYADFGTLTADLADEVAAAAAGRAFILAGHSLGATIGYEVARELRDRGAPGPALLAVSAMSAPQVTLEYARVDQMSDEDLIAGTRASGQLPAHVLDDPELLELVIEPLRADLMLADSYRHAPGPPLSCAISVFGARQDPLVPVEALGPWRDLTTGPAVIRTYDGDHFYLWGHEREVASAILSDLRTLAVT